MATSTPPTTGSSGIPSKGRRGCKDIVKSLRQALRLRLKRQALITRAIRKRRELRKIADRSWKIGKTDILCALVIRNEALRLPWFLDHHRKMGVSHFLIVDNGSTDGSAEYLRDQTDVSLWSTPASYRKSRFGLDWLNWLLLRYGHGHWCLVLDADELLVYPYANSRPLPALTGWLASKGYKAMPAMMLDLYPKGPIDQGNYSSGQNPLDHLAWFDSGNYSARIQEKTNSLWIQGGPRTRQFFHATPARSPTLNKIPLVKWHWRYAFLNSTHSLLPNSLNKTWDDAGAERTSGVLLHTKFLPEVIDKSAEEKDRRQHFADPSRFGDYYDQVIAAPDLWSPKSCRYISWRQLEALGLMSRGGWI